MVPESRARIVAAIHETTAFCLKCDATRLKDGAQALTIEMGNQSFLMQFSFDADVFERVTLTLHLPNCTRDRHVCLHCFQSIPPRQPTVGIDGKLQQVIYTLDRNFRRSANRVHDEISLRHDHSCFVVPYSFPTAMQLQPKCELPFPEIPQNGARSSHLLRPDARTHSVLSIFHRAKNAPRRGVLRETLNQSGRIESVGLRGNRTANRSRD